MTSMSIEGENIRNPLCLTIYVKINELLDLTWMLQIILVKLGWDQPTINL